jgi:cholesterol oxidase
MSDQPKINRRSALKSAAAAATGVAAASVSSSASAQRSRRPAKNLVQITKRLKACDTPLKQRAAQDYTNSLQQYGGQLANPIRDLMLTTQKDDRIHFGALVIGSGYGASIAAAKISKYLRPEHRMCIIERGKEWIPGTFPETFKDVSGNARAVLAGPTRGQVVQPLGLFNLMMNDEVNVLSGNGLGGGSLMNASIALRPHPEVFAQQRWPSAINNIEIMEPYYKRVAAQLSLTRTPFDQTPKVRSRRIAAARLSSNPSFYDRNFISVMYDHRHLDQQMRNAQGMIQRPCTLCGNCINGCNVGAKNTLAMNYLPIAKHNGTEMYTQCEVNSIEKMDGYYRVNVTYIDDTENKFTRHPISINTRMVVVGAGSPASSTILMESQHPSFQFSPRLGMDWSGNGDTIGFVVNAGAGNNIAGYGACETDRPGVGPTVQTSLNFYRDIELQKRLLIQDAAIPRGVVNLFTALMGDLSLDRSMVMLGMGHDEGRGKIEKKDGRWQIIWKGLKESPYRKMVFREFEKVARAHGGRYKRLKAFGDNLVTVHPLGSCGMSDSSDGGVVNHLGQVYDGLSGGIHPNLYVADGSIIPTAIGVNPYMTIGALSDRIASHIVQNPLHTDLFAAV